MFYSLTARIACSQASVNSEAASGPLRLRLALPRKARIGIPTLVLLLVLPLSLFADSSLSEKSPFLPPGHGVKPPEPVKPEVQPQGPISNQLEFRGIVQMDGKYQFSIFDKKDQKGYWLTEGEAAKSGIVVRDYDTAASSIIVNMNGRSERLTLEKSSDSPLPVAQTKPAVANPAPAVLPPELRNSNQAGNGSNRRTIPRRRVILPKKTN